MAFDAVLGDADDDRADGVEFGLRLGEGFRLAGAAGGVVLGIEVEHDRMSTQLAQTDIAAFVARQGEVGRFVTGLQGGGHAILLVGSGPDYGGHSAEAQSRTGPGVQGRGRGIPAC